MLEVKASKNDWLNNDLKLSSFRRNLVFWGHEHFRSFPWRETFDPYAILIAEIMLHRTQVVQVVPVYEVFMACYPDLHTLAAASKSDLSSVLQPLGLQWRIDLVYEMAQDIMKLFEGEVPVEKSALLSLSGISDYIAGGVRCFAWNLPEPLIDTNTVRITGRLFGLPVKDSSRRNARFRQFITSMVDPDHPRSYNYALLDLAHLICLKKQEPLCNDCPVLKYCCFGQNNIEITVNTASGR